MPIDLTGTDTADLDALAARVRAWLEEHLPAPWRQAALDGDQPALARILADQAVTSAWYAELGESGLATPGWPAEYGGLGLAADATAVVTDELTRLRADRPGNDFIGLALAGPTIIEWGSDEQKQRFLPPLTLGEHRWCQLFSEPGAGSDLASLRTRAVKDGDHWVVNGQKVWSSFSDRADFGLLMARTDPSQPKHRGITYFLLDMHSDGVEVKPLRELTGNAMFNTVFIDDVFVPDDLVLGEVNRGWEVSRTTLTAERVSIGNSEAPFLANLNGFVEFIRDGHFDQIDQNHAGRLIAEGHAAKVLNMRSTLLTLAGGDPMPAAAISKMLSMRTGQGYAEFAVSSFGTDGAIGDPEQLPGQWAQMLLASRATTIYGGTSEVQLNIIAERLLGLPRDP
jgi:3-oxochol-4-en-24-oyl-CoA dehydrogenase